MYLSNILDNISDISLNGTKFKFGSAKYVNAKTSN